MPPDLAAPAAFGYGCVAGHVWVRRGQHAGTFAHVAGSRLEGCAVVLCLPLGKQAGPRL